MTTVRNPASARSAKMSLTSASNWCRELSRFVCRAVELSDDSVRRDR